MSDADIEALRQIGLKCAEYNKISTEPTFNLDSAMEGSIVWAIKKAWQLGRGESE